jgi:nitroreductase
MNKSMDAIENLLTRKSVRKYSSQPVSQGDLELILKAGMQAPSARNCQPWHFVVMTERAMMDEVPKFHPYASSMNSAPLAILVCGDEKLAARPKGWRVDCAAAVENILLAAHALGMGAVWMAVDPDEKRLEGMCRLIQFPEGITPFALVSIGYPLEDPVLKERYKRERIHYNAW